MSWVCRKYLVAGRVQGVYYRATAARHARELQIRGYAKNLPDGRVEVLALGPEPVLEELVKRLWIGSSASKVTSVEASEALDVVAEDVPLDFITG
jgi:acylphosphatase